MNVNFLDENGLKVVLTDQYGLPSINIVFSLSLSTIPSVRQPDSMKSRPMGIHDKGHVEAGAEVEIGGEKDDEAGVVSVTAPENEAESAEVTNENATIAETEIKRKNEVGVQTDEVEMTREKDGAEAERETEKEGEAEIAKTRGEEAPKKTKEAGKKTDRAADKWRYKSITICQTTQSTLLLGLLLKPYRLWWL